MGSPGSERPTFSPLFRDEVREIIEDGLAPLAGPLDALAISPLSASKHTLAAVLGCEVRAMDEIDTFPGWSPPLARGKVAHKAIELSVFWRGAPSPLELVGEALARLTETDTSLGLWLQTISEVERAEITAEANDRVAAFLEAWPPLKREWRPVTEATLSQEFCGDRIVLRGKVDLMLGQTRGSEAGKVLVDFKTGGFSPAHLEDLRFYALLELLKVGVPPRRVASHYLDSGRIVPADITTDAMLAAAARLVAALTTLVELMSDSRSPVVRTGPSCRWCPLLSTCGAGQAALAALADPI